MDALNYKFEKYVSEMKAIALLKELADWQARVDEHIRAEKKRVDNLSIAQRVHERRSK